MSCELNEQDKPAKAMKSVEQEVFLNVLKAADVLAAELADVLKPSGLSPTQYNVLRILRGKCAGCCAGGHVDPGAQGIPCREIGERMITRDPDITRLLDRLEDRGLITRGRDSADRRVINIRISEPGLELIATLDQPVLDLHKRQLGHLGQEKLNQLVRLLEEVRSKCKG